MSELKGSASEFGHRPEHTLRGGLLMQLAEASDYGPRAPVTSVAGGTQVSSDWPLATLPGRMPERIPSRTVQTWHRARTHPASEARQHRAHIPMYLAELCP